MRCLAALVLLAVVAPLMCVSPLHAQCKEGQVDINTATEAQLRTVKGIGEKKAQAIIEGRPFTSVDDLRRVKGVGAKSLEKWRDQLCVGKKKAAKAAVPAAEEPQEETAAPAESE
jgi:competence protein ComEA